LPDGALPGTMRRMAMATNNNAFTDADPVCFECFEDEGLRAHIQSEGTVDTCCLCGQERETLTIYELGELMYPILCEHFVPGPDAHDFDGEGDDSGHAEQQGQPLSELMKKNPGAQKWVTKRVRK
jgi:hypothetical protein